MEQLNSQDSTYLWMETPRMSMHAGMVLLYDPSTAPGGKIRFRDILKYVDDRLHTSKVFRQRLAKVAYELDRPYWIEDGNFDLEYHVRNVTLPPPGDWQQFCSRIAEIHSVPLDRGHPLWEMHMIEGLDQIDGLPKGCFAVFLKGHQAAIDAHTATEIMGALHSIMPMVPKPKPVTEEWVPEDEPSMATVLRRATINSSVSSTLNLCSSVLNIAPKLPGMLFAGLSEVTESLHNGQPLPPVPKTRFAREISPHRFFDSRVFDLADLLKIQKLVDGASVNDVLLALCGGALRKFLEVKGELPNQPLVAMVPVDMTREENQESIVTVSLCTHIKDPIERLAAIHKSSSNSKELIAAAGTREMIEISKNFPGALHSFALQVSNEARLGSTYLLANTVVSKVPGPQLPLYMNGAKLLRFMAVRPTLDGMGLGFPIVSYNRRIEISMVGCSEIVPDPEKVAKYLQDSFEELTKAIPRK